MANKETRIFKSNTFEEFRQKTNEVSLHLGDNEQLNVSLTDKTFDFANVSAGDIFFGAEDNNSKIVQFNIKTEETLDNTGGYIILTGSPSLTGFVADATLTQPGSGGYSATIVSVSTDKILVKNSSGVFNSTQNLLVGSDSIPNANVVRIISEAYNVGVVRVYINGTEINQNLDAGGFHVPNYSANIPLLNSPTVTAFTEGSTVYQGTNLANATFSGTVLSASATDLKLKNHTGSFNASAVIKIDGSSSTITGANHQDISNKDTTIGNAIVLNTPATLNDDIKVYSPSLVDAVNELQDDVGITENLTTVSGNLVGAVNEIEAVFDASTHEISAGSNAFNVTSGTFTVDSSDDIILDADGSDVVLKDAGVQYGSLTNSSGNIVVKSGSTTMLTGNGANAIFANNVTVTQDVDVDRNLNVDGATTLNGTTIDGNLDLNGSVDVSTNATVHGNLDVDGATTLDGTTIDGNLDLNGNVDVSGTSDLHGAVEMNSTLGVDGNFRVGSDKFNVTASSGNTQIDGTLEVDGTAGIDGNLRVGADKFNVTASTGNTQIDGALNVDGSTTLNGTTLDGDLDLNGNADISTNLTVGGVVDIGTLNAKFTNTNNVKLALNELHDELGNAVITGSGTPAAGQSNITNAVNAIDAEIGSTSYIGSSISFALDAAQDYIGTYNNTVSSTITGALNQLHTEVGTLSLNTTATNLTSAVNELHGEINSNDTDIGNLMTLIDGASTVDSSITFTGLAGTNIKSAIQELASEKLDLNTGGTTGALARINAGTDSIQNIISRLNLSGNVVFQNGGTNANKMTFNTGTTLDLSNATLLLPGAASSVNIFGVSFLKVDGNIEDPMGFSVDRDHVTQSNTETVSLQWHENHSETDPARGWQLVGLNDSGNANTADVVTFYNAKELIANNTESGINVTWDSINQNFDFDVINHRLTFTGDVTGSGIIYDSNTVDAGGVLNQSIALTVQPNSVALTTDTTGDYVRTVNGTTNQITVSGAGTEGRAATLSIPTDFRMPGTAKVLSTTGASSATTGALTVAGGVGIGEDLYIAGNLYVEGTRTELNVTTLEVEDTLILAGNNLSSEPSSGGFGIETGPITSPSGVASGVTGAHSIVYNYGTDRWEADGSLILSEATLGSPTIEGNTFGASNNLDFSAGTGISVTTTTTGNDIDVVITNNDKGSDQAIFKNFAAGTGGTATANTNNDTLTLAGGSQINTTRAGDTITIDHANTSTLDGTTGQAGDEDGTYIKSVTVDSNGHMTGVTYDVFDNRYDNYGSWSATDGDGTTYTLTSGDTLTFAEGTGIDVNFTADDELTFKNTDKGSDQAIFKNFGAGSGGTATANTNNDTLTISGGTALSSVRSGDTITINHSSVGAASVNNSGVTFIQDLTIDDNGHVTDTASATVPTPGDGTVTVEAGTLLHLSANQDGIFTMNQEGDDDITINHSDVTRTDTTSAATPGYAGTFTAVDSVTTSDQGHLSAINLKTVTMPSAQTLPTVNDGTVSLVGGVALHINETDKSFSMNQSDAQTITFDHDNISRTDATSTAAPGYAGTFTAVDSVTSNAQGHITAVNVKTVTMPSTQSSVSGNAGSATILETARNFSIGGDITATAVSFDGSGAVALTASIDANVVSNTELSDMAASTIKGRITSNGNPQDLTAAQVITMLSLANSATTTHTSANTGNQIVSRNASGNFSAGTITATLSGTASVATQLRVTPTQTNSTYNLLFTSSHTGTGTTSDTIYRDAGLSYNPSTNTLGGSASVFKGDLSLCSGYAYGNLTGRPTIPTNNNQLTNGAGYTTYTSNQATNNNSNVKFDGLRVGDTTAAPANTIQCTGDVVAFASSDERLKDNIKPITNSLEKVGQLKGYEFDWNDKQVVHSGHDVGVIAQEVEKVVPEIVETREHDGYKAVKYEKLVPLLINAINELTEQNKLIRSELENLKSINR